MTGNEEGVGGGGEMGNDMQQRLETNQAQSYCVTTPLSDFVIAISVCSQISLINS